ncbi:MAG: serine/threonine protein kinase [Verrucomicrobiales bacterium]|jgi:serine/threonine protein kinase
MTETSSASTCPDCGTPLPEDSPGELCPSCLMRQALASRTKLEPGREPSSSPPPSPEEMADKFPQFELTECLGRGGMGVVYKARQKSLDRWAAIKILAPELVGEEQFAERFAREAQILASLSHPNIVTVFDYGETDGLYYIVMEFVDGVNLRDLLREGKLEPQQALKIVPPVCEALQYAHDKGIVHRDIKPENLLLDRDGRIKIADFGIAALAGASGERSGTPPYMSPEQGEPSIEVDHRTDIYALGAVLYEMLTGERPGSPLQLPSQKVLLDIRIDDIVLRALNTEPERRYRSADEFRTVVETVAPPPPPPAAPASPVTQKTPSPDASAAKHFDPRLITVSAILMIVLGAVNAVSMVFPILIFPFFGGVIQEFPAQMGLLFLPYFLLTIAASILAIIGGHHMLKRSSRSWAIAGAVASCCLTSFWWPIGIAVGAFALVLLLSNKDAASKTPESADSTDVVPPGPKLSGMAVTGAILQALPWALILPVLGSGGLPTPVRVLLLLLLFPIPGGILGWIAAGKIRASEGQLKGMGFAIFAAIPTVALLAIALLSAAAGGLVGLVFFLDPLGPDQLTLSISGTVVTLTGLAVLWMILGTCYRRLKGKPAPTRRLRRWLTASILIILWIAIGALFWLQRPQQLDSWLSLDSDDQQHLAMGSTWRRTAVFGDDRLTFRFVVQGKGGTIQEKREIPVPVDQLAKDYRVAPASDYFFGDKGNIQWSESSVEFQIEDLTLHKIAF